MQVDNQSISSASSFTQPPEETSRQKNKIELIKQYALTFLGQGYDSSKKGDDGLLERTFVKFSTDLVDILENDSRDAQAFGTTYQGVTDKLQKKLGGKFNLECPLFSLGPQTSYKAPKINREEKNKIIFGICHIDYHKCRLNETPKQRTGLYLDQKGDCYVKSVWVYTGYKIFCEIQAQSYLCSSAKNFEIEGKLKPNISFKGVTINLGSDLETLKEKLQEKTINSVKMVAEGFGGYSISTTKLSPKNWEEMSAAILEIQSDYQKKADHIAIRASFINETCLAPYPKARPPIFSSQNLTMQSSSRTPPPIKFTELAREIAGFDNENYLRGIESVRLIDLLRSFNNTFFNMFSQKLEKSEDLNYTMVMGRIGAGKSILTGYLNRAKIVYQKGLNGSTEYASYSPEHVGNFPTIGTKNGQTKGIQVFKSYIDTGGIPGLDGAAGDIMNSMAIRIAAKYYSPKKLIIVLNSASFDNRSTIFLEIIDHLEKIISNATSEKTLSSILFVVNDNLKKNEIRKTKEDIIGSIDKTINMIEEEQKHLIDKDIPQEKQSWLSLGLTLRAWLSGKPPEEQEKEIKKVNPRVTELDGTIELLKTIKRLDNIVVADIFTEDSRKKIQPKKNCKETNSSLSFRSESFVENGSHIFRSFILATSNYFCSIFDRKVQLDNKIKEINDELSLNKEILNSSSTSIQQQKMEPILEELAKVNAEIESLKKHREKLLDSTEIVFWKDLAEDQIIPARPLWHILPIKKHFKTIRNRSGLITPIDHVKLNPSRGTEDKGYFYKEKENRCHLGKYEVRFIQEWRFREERKVKILLYVKKKDHPSTHAELENINLWLNGDKQHSNRKTGIHNVQTGLISHKESLERQLDMCDPERKGKINYPELIQKRQYLKDQRKSIQQELKIVEEKLFIYQNYCNLLAEVIKEVGPDLAIEDHDKEGICRSFLSFLEN